MSGRSLMLLMGSSRLLSRRIRRHFAASGLSESRISVPMLLSAGARLGPYEIISPLGAGGMGEVYRARDTKLGRGVAIKVIPEAVATHPDRIARFEREAKVLASLNHPHIAALFGMEESSGRHFLVMELVEGETLAERIASPNATGRGLPVEDALKIALQIAGALEAAHECGIIHRDLKPANVMVTPDEVVKVLDFGLAKAAEGGRGQDLSQSATVSFEGTREGTILGTAAYMSPEQARGKPVDKRTDIWAFGCVIYEMLTGRLAFSGETASDAVAAILSRDPDWLGVACGDAGERPAAVAPIPRERSKAPAARHRGRTNRARRDARAAIRGRSSRVTGSVRANRHDRCARQGACPVGLGRRSSVGGRDRLRRWRSGASAPSAAQRWTPASFVPRSFSPRARKSRRIAARRISAPGGALPCRLTDGASRSWRDGMPPDDPCSGCARWTALSHRAWLGPRVPHIPSGRQTLGSSPSWRRAR